MNMIIGVLVRGREFIVLVAGERDFFTNTPAQITIKFWS